MKNFSYFWKLNWVVAVALFCCWVVQNEILMEQQIQTGTCLSDNWIQCRGAMPHYPLMTIITTLWHWHKDAHLHIISPHSIAWGFLSSAAKHGQSGAAQFFGLLLLTFVAPWVLSLDKWWLSKKPIPPWFHSWADTFSSTLRLRSPWFVL